MSKLHFHSLDALRFFAFFKVFLLHLPNQGGNPIFGYLKSGGGIGVSFFFVLSGFLITYLLAKEKIQTQRIDIKKFLVRRTLRIWPLFLLLVTIAALLPYDLKDSIGFHMVGGGYEFDWRYSFTFLENYKMLIEDNFPKTTPLSVFWSLCIEEHFYLLWVIAFAIIPTKHLPKFLVAGIVVSWISRFIEITYFSNQTIVANDLLTNLDFFAIVGLLGYFTARNYEKLSARILKLSNGLRWLIIVLTVLTVIFQPTLFPQDKIWWNIIGSTIVALIFTCCIAMFIPQRSSVRIGNKLLAYLGVRSYGLYVFHIIFIHVALQYCADHNILIASWTSILAFTFVTLSLSVAVSIISYQFFELPLLRLRDRLTATNKR